MSNRDNDLAPSKSARKRAHHELQSLAESLMALSPVLLDRIPLTDALREGVVFGRDLSKGARKRHVRHLANLLAREELEPVNEALAAVRGESRQETARLHRAERWRVRLIEEGDDALGELVGHYPSVERQRVRELVRGVARERAREAPPRQFRLLLRYLRELDELHAEDTEPPA